MLRNREITRALAAWAAITLAAGILAAQRAGSGAALIAVAASCAAAVPFLVLTRWRYRALARLAARIDAVLHGERSLDLAHMDEGELAVLASELDKMVARLNLTADDLNQERQALADALADISHQLKTPLTSLSIATELLRRDLTERGDCADEVARVRQIERLQVHVEHLVSALLKLSRLDAGKIRFGREPVAVAALAEAAFEPLAIAYDITEVAFVQDIEPGASFTGDAAWSAEALGNILKNCLEHTPAGGTVTLSAHEDALACRIRVEDTGPGIAESDLPHVFERFYRGAQADGEASSAVDPGGIGIGLSLARSLITGQDGALTASNARDEAGRVTGARFDLTFFKDQSI